VKLESLALNEEYRFKVLENSVLGEYFDLRERAQQQTG
jgi:hypothetical protein